MAWLNSLLTIKNQLKRQTLKLVIESAKGEVFLALFYTLNSALDEGGLKFCRFDMLLVLFYVA